MKIILIGFMGAGKTTVARSLGKKLSLKVIEMDEIIEKTAKKNIRQIFEDEGEMKFRELEIITAKKMRKVNDCIISTGGGVIMNKINLDYLREKGKVIFLRTNFLEIIKRLKNDNTRPLFKNIKIAKKLFDFRQKLYVQYADLIVDTDCKSVKKITYEIIGQK